MAIAGWYALYPGLMDGCWLNGESVTAQAEVFMGVGSVSMEAPLKVIPITPS